GCYSASGELRSLAARGATRVALQTLRPTVAGSTNHLGRAIWVQPLGGNQIDSRSGGDRMGFLALAGEVQDDWDRLAARQGAAAPTMRRDDGALCYLPVAERGPRASELAEQLRVRIAGDIPSVVLALGKDAASVATWSRSLREAEQALLLGRQLLDDRRVLEF